MSFGKYEYQNDFARKYYGQGVIAGEADGVAKGKVEGKAEAVLEVLRARGLEVAAEAEAVILACRDADRLARWLREAVTADSVDDILD